MATLEQQETHINIDYVNKTANIYTNNKSMLNKLKKLSDNSACSVFKNTDEEMIIEVPMKWIKVSPPRTVVLTQEQKRERSERMKSVVARRKQENI